MSATAPGDRLVAVGAVVKPHGVRGELCIDCHADSPFLFEEAGRVFLRRPGGRAREYAVLGSRPHQGRMLLTLRGVSDRDAADALRGLEVAVAAADLPEPEEDEVYLHELEGLAVRLPDGRPLGELTGFLFAGGQETWAIRDPEGREILLPATPEFVLDIDLDARVAVVEPPEGLLDLYIKDQQ
ncbi:ribosome maturation factor RimM [Desulfovibrio aminophilus]|nr:ribosome maturation factor RimM [Desulfovibrio aminophilus]MCM0754714.1 ribosome maturation factor RimM [Desulfovibrio aminophilus]